MDCVTLTGRRPRFLPLSMCPSCARSMEGIGVERRLQENGDFRLEVENPRPPCSLDFRATASAPPWQWTSAWPARILPRHCLPRLEQPPRTSPPRFPSCRCQTPTLPPLGQPAPSLQPTAPLLRRTPPLLQRTDPLCSGNERRHKRCSACSWSCQRNVHECSAAKGAPTHLKIERSFAKKWCEKLIKVRQCGLMKIHTKKMNG